MYGIFHKGTFCHIHSNLLVPLLPICSSAVLTPLSIIALQCVLYFITLSFYLTSNEKGHKSKAGVITYCIILYFHINGIIHFHINIISYK